MSRLDVSATSTEYIRVSVVAREEGVRVDPTSGTVNMAFISRGDADGGPVSSDWKPAEWETDGTTYYARCLVGPTGAITLTKGTYRIWIKFTAASELPVKAVGYLYVF